MKLRIRCPSCRTVLSVPAGADPVCPTCGFGAVGDQPQEPQWNPTPAEGAAGAEGDEGTWEPVSDAPAAAEGDWVETPQTPEGWGEPPAEPPKKRGLFGRRKK